MFVLSVVIVKENGLEDSLYNLLNWILELSVSIKVMVSICAVFNRKSLARGLYCKKLRFGVCICNINLIE